MTFLDLIDQATDLFNQLAPDLPPLMWSVNAGEVRGQVDPGADDDEAGQTLTLWADRLGLLLVEDDLPAAREYAAVRGDWRLVVWGVTDQARWAEDSRRAIKELGEWTR
jgi:hypothetical protein